MGSRPRYPSDYRRWFKVREDILDDRRFEECSPEAFRFYFLLLAMLKRTNSRDGKIILGRRAMNHLAGRSQLRYSERTAREVADYSLIALSRDGDSFLITVPKWAKVQEFTTASLPTDSGLTPDSRVEQSRVVGAVASALDPPTEKRQDPYRLPPGSPILTEKRVQELIAIKPNGVEYSPQDVACWFAHKHPQMVSRRITAFSSAAGKWFSNVKPGEINESREWVRSVNSKQSAKRIAAEIDSKPQEEFSLETLKEIRDALT